MSIELLEVSWRVGTDRFSFVLTPDGTPHLTGPGVTELAAFGPAAPPPVRERPAKATRPGPARRGQAWSEDEETQLREGFARGDEPAAIATTLGRTSGSVRARLVRMGLLDEVAAGLRYPVPRATTGAESGGEPSE
ncbi:MAG: hypothetical protein Q8P41_02420 [Pseudomonadota bacterium]|nr:hypothetical protein [Pseudomonadota bacterium]